MYKHPKEIVIETQPKGWKENIKFTKPVFIESGKIVTLKVQFERMCQTYTCENASSVGTTLD